MEKVQTLHLGLLAPLLLLVFLASPTTSCTVQEAASLLQFLAQLSPDSGSMLSVSAGSWQNGTSCCKWKGVTCDSNGMVTELWLRSMGLTGYISAAPLANLTGLRRLDLSCNSLSGGLPPQLLSSGSIAVLDVSFNILRGELQEFPSSLPYHPLQVLNISSNFFEGEFPSMAWQKKKDLIAINASQNNFSGGIPSSFCAGSRSSFAVLDLSYNHFSGGIPAAIAECSALRVLKVDDNNLTGEIPKILYSCTNLTTLHLSSNMLHGQLSPSLANLTSLSSVSLANNAFKNVSNALHALSSFKNITTLLMGLNFRGEVMPDDIRVVEGFQSLQVLSLGSCFLSGNVPFWLSKLARLEILDLSNNELTGPVPVWINSLNYLYFLDMSNNRFTGELPKAIMEMPMLQYDDLTDHSNPMSVRPVYEGALLEYGIISDLPATVNLGNNQLMGVIPSGIGQLKSLVVLNLSLNSLSGGVPQQLCFLKNLLVIDLSNNHLTGPVPSGLNNLQFLSELCSPLFDHNGASADEAPSAPSFSTEETTAKIIFTIAFAVFFFVGVIYDQIVLSRFFGKPYSDFRAGV